MPIFVTGHIRAGKQVRSYNRRGKSSVIKELRRSIRKTGTGTYPISNKLRAKYLKGYQALRYGGRGASYDPSGFMQRTVKRALGKKTSIYG